MEDKLKSSRRSSFIWSFFTVQDRNSSVCRMCGIVLSTKGGSTSNLRRHIYAKHTNIEYKKKKLVQKKKSLGQKSNEMEEAEVIVLDQFVGENVTQDLVIEENNDAEREGRNGIPKRSTIWIYFNEVARDRGKCSLCGTIISIRGGSTSNLRRHMKSKHRKIILDRKKILTNSARKKKHSVKSNDHDIEMVENFTGEKFHSEVVFHDYTNTLEVSDDNKIIENEEMVEWENKTSEKVITIKGNNETDRTTLEEIITLPEEIFFNKKKNHNRETNHNSNSCDSSGKTEDSHNNAKVEALMCIAQNLGRIATSFEKIAGFLCSDRSKNSNTGA